MWIGFSQGWKRWCLAANFDHVDQCPCRKAIFKLASWHLISPDPQVLRLLRRLSQAWKLTVRCSSQLQLATLDMAGETQAGLINIHNMNINMKLWVRWYRRKNWILEVDQHFPDVFVWCFQWLIAESWWKPHGNCFAVKELTEALHREGSCEAQFHCRAGGDAADMRLILWLHVHVRHIHISICIYI